MRIVYFAHDLTDPAIARRVRMLLIGGAEVRLLGFRRSATPIAQIEGVPVIDLGQTFDRQLINRLGHVVRCSLGAGKWKDTIAWADLLLARNLEMATIANAARMWAGSRTPLVYECLDIHWASIGNGAPAKVLRGWEREILKRSATLIVSSPAYLSNHFNRLGVKLPPVILAENKRVLAEPVERPSLHQETRQPPWRIGWFGGLRCEKSFRILLGLAERNPGLVDIVLRGRPPQETMPLVHAHLPLPNMRYEGPYRQDELAAIYADCDLIWTVEYFTQNSYWALGNRLYEGGFYNVPAVVLAQCEMGTWLKRHGTGVLIEDPEIEFEPFIRNLSSEQYAALRESCASVPTSALVWTDEDCHDLVQRMAGRTHG